MTQIAWGETIEVEHGVDRAVLYPKDGSDAVTWSGIQSIEIDSPEGAASYYVDGRPFLYLPIPTEYSATINAYTFPDELLNILGLGEFNGLVFDSQMSDSFDLSYRTSFVGANGREAHKIHLIYNAVASLQPISYGSQASDLSPVNLAFEIKAVPVRVRGYRATAHVVINTADISQAKLEEIEVLLYGANGSSPVMPNPETIYDILSGGDAIVVTLHDDGTWTARGSFDKIHMIAPGIFRIDDINAEHHGDGTYTISTGGNTVVRDEFE